MKSNEIELKLLTDEASFEKIEQYFTATYEPKNQTNYYFDSSKYLLAGNNITLRIRRENNLFIICMKVRIKDKGVAIHSLEYNVEIGYEDFIKISLSPNSIINYLPQEAQKKLFTVNSQRCVLNLQGSIQNERKYYNFILGYQLELDKTTFPDGNLIYEIEIENIKAEDQEQVFSAFNEYGINYTINIDSKYNRFLQSIKKNSRL